MLLVTILQRVHNGTRAWSRDIASKPKLRSYIKIKADYGETDRYVLRTRVKVHRSLLACLRQGTAPMQIEIGRYVCFPVEERLCNSCMVEDEEHFCVGCPGLMEARGPLLKLMEEA